MRARDHCTKFQIKQHTGVRILNGTWGHPEQPSSKMFMVQKHVFSLGEELDRGYKQLKTRNTVKVILRKPRPHPELELDA